MNKRPHTSTDNLGNDSSPTNPPYSKKQLLLKTITELDFTGFVDAPPSDPNLPEYARTMIINQQKMLKQLNGLLRVASELLTEQKTFDDSFEQRQREHLLVITGLPESTEQQPMDRAASDNRNVRQILNELNIDRCLPSAVFRLGKQREPGSKPRPIKVQFPCTAAVVEALRNKKKLVGGKFKGINIRKSMTKEELSKRNELIEICKQKRLSTKFDFVVYAGEVLLRSEIPKFKQNLKNLPQNNINF